MGSDCISSLSLLIFLLFPRCIGFLSFTKDPIKHDLLQTQVLVLQPNFLNYKLRASLLSKIMS